ncbi:MAG: hypothetical protein HOQ13_02105 [Dermatophilaceae bacterium]|nr:hypothetical protein [Dermatophilaceae bacterium]
MVRNVDVLPAAAAASLVAVVAGRPVKAGSASGGDEEHTARSWCLTAESFGDVPAGLADDEDGCRRAGMSRATLHRKLAQYDVHALKD